jgi:hypothetical protein
MRRMDVLIAVLVRIVEIMFFVGLAGSAVVWLLTTVEDVENMFSGEEPAGGGAKTEVHQP